MMAGVSPAANGCPGRPVSRSPPPRAAAVPTAPQRPCRRGSPPLAHAHIGPLSVPPRGHACRAPQSAPRGSANRCSPCPRRPGQRPGAPRRRAGKYRTAARSLWTTSAGMWMATQQKVFSAHRPWTTLAQVGRAMRGDRYAMSPLVSSACAQGGRRVCTEFPQGCAHCDWTPCGGQHKTVRTTYYN
jgi:hypothetical protein